MKKYLLAASILATVTSAPAFADTDTFTVTADNPPKCSLTSNQYTAVLPADSLSGPDGKALTTVSDAVAQKLNALDVNAWCTGQANGINMYRTPFVANGTNGEQVDDFNTAVIYDITLDIADAERTDGGRPTEGTSDGQGRGPGVPDTSIEAVKRFGPIGDGTQLVFAEELASEAVENGGAGPVARDTFDGSENRLIAGLYTSTVVIEITPGN